MNVLMSRNDLVPLELCVSALEVVGKYDLQEKTPNSILKDIDHEYQNFIVDHH